MIVIVGMALLAAVLALSSASLSQPVLWISLPAEEGGPCTSERIVGAIRSHNPGVGVQEMGAAVPGAVPVAITRVEGAWILTIDRAEPGPLRRTLPEPGADCVATSDTAALILERYLDGSVGSGPAALDDLGVEASSETKADRRHDQPRFEGFAEVGTSVALGSPVPTLELDMGARRGAIQFGVGGSAALTQEPTLTTAPPSVGYTLQLASTRLTGAWRPKVGPGAIRLELTPGVALFWASQAGGPGGTSFGAAPYVGLRAGYELALPARFGLSLLVAGRALLGNPGIPVGSGPTLSFGPVLPPFDGNLALALSRTFF